MTLDDLKFIQIREPSEEELRAGSAQWLSRTGPCLIDHWPKELLALSAPTIFLDLPDNIGDLFDKGPAIFADFATEIDAKLGWDRRFFRLNSRSPKDNTWPLVLPVSCSGKEILSVMSCSERMLDDLVWFKHSTAKAKLCLREFWPEVRAQAEYRCFIKDGAILAIAEYANAFTSDLWPLPPADFDKEIVARITTYLSDVVIPRLHIHTVVVDLFVGRKEIKLIEINPYGMSDPVGAQSYEAIEQTIPGIARLPRHPASSLPVNGDEI